MSEAQKLGVCHLFIKILSWNGTIIEVESNRDYAYETCVGPMHQLWKIERLCWLPELARCDALTLFSMAVAIVDR